MPSVNEPNRTALGAALKAGVDTLSLNQQLDFVLYKRLVLPLDGFVFWVKASIMVPDPLPDVRKTFSIMGSVHDVTEQMQLPDEVYTNTRMVFSSENEARDFDLIGPDYMYLTTWHGNQFQFSSVGMRYDQANLWHYIGHAVNNVMLPQIINDIAQLPDPTKLIVSNSLPAWLALNTYNPIWDTPLPAPAFQLYPSYIVPSNIVPPFGVIHIPENGTTTHQTVPYLDDTMSHQQLAEDHVEVTLWGCDNDLALAWMDAVIQYTDDWGAFGIVNMPIMSDDKRPQVDILALAKKKRILFDVSYNQQSVRDITRQLILSAFMTINTSDTPIPNPPNIPIFP